MVKKKEAKETVDATLARLAKEMAKPRVVKSAGRRVRGATSTRP
jgi:hypothetical protein